MRVQAIIALAIAPRGDYFGAICPLD